MKWFFILFVVIVLFSSFFLIYSYHDFSPVSSELYNPYVSDSFNGDVAGDATESAVLESDVPIHCVLSYGTYTLNQQGCDELSSIDAAPDPKAEMISCNLADGTFLFTQKECDILKTATGSRDVLKTLD